MERGDDIVKVDRTLIGMDEEHRERDHIMDSIKNRKPMEAGKSRDNVVTTHEHVDRPITNRCYISPLYMEVPFLN